MCRWQMGPLSVGRGGKSIFLGWVARIPTRVSRCRSGGTRFRGINKLRTILPGNPHLSANLTYSEVTHGHNLNCSRPVYIGTHLGQFRACLSTPPLGKCKTGGQGGTRNPPEEKGDVFACVCQPPPRLVNEKWGTPTGPREYVSGSNRSPCQVQTGLSQIRVRFSQVRVKYVSSSKWTTCQVLTGPRVRSVLLTGHLPRDSLILILIE